MLKISQKTKSWVKKVFMTVISFDKMQSHKTMKMLGLKLAPSNEFCGDCILGMRGQLCHRPVSACAICC